MKFKLEVFPGDFGLPSMDLDCLRAILFCRIARINVDIVNQSNIAFNTVPCLKDSSNGQVIAQTFASIIDYFRENAYQATGNVNTSSNITDMFVNGVDKFGLSMRQELLPALLQTWWRDDNNYNEFLRAWHAERLPFPTNFFWPRRLRDKALDEFTSLVPIHIDQNNADKIEKYVVDKAEKYITALSKHINDSSSFLFGEKATIADVNLLSYLLLFHRAPAKNQQLKSVITQLEPVLKYVERVAEPYLKDAPGLNSSDPYGNTLEESMKLKPKDLIWSGAFAVVAMIFFAVTHGILNISDRHEHSHSGGTQDDGDDEGTDEFEE